MHIVLWGAMDTPEAVGRRRFYLGRHELVRKGTFQLRQDQMPFDMYCELQEIQTADADASAYEYEYPSFNGRKRNAAVDVSPLFILFRLTVTCIFVSSVVDLHFWVFLCM